MNDKPPKYDPKYTLIAIVVIGLIILALLVTRKGSSNAAESETARKASQSIKDARGW